MRGVVCITTVFALFGCLKGIESTACPSGWKVFNGHCYKFAADKRTWSDARMQCQKAGADLVKISSTAENNFVNQNKKGIHAWLGLQRGSDHKFRWADGTSAAFTMWYPTEPNNLGGMEDCGHMRGNPKSGTWNDIKCSNLFGYVCEKITCPSGWKIFNGHCYKFAADKRTWSDARMQCQRAGADLVKISSTAENNFVRQNKKGTNAWLGLLRSSDHKFRWADGTSVAFTAWSPGEPNDSGGVEDCGHMWKHSKPGTWNDAQCSSLYGYVCKKGIQDCA